MIPEIEKKKQVRNVSQQVEPTSYRAISQQVEPPVVEPPTKAIAIPSDISQLLGPTASKYLKNYLSKTVKTDSTFGIRIEDGRIMMGNLPIKIDRDNVQLMNEDFWYEGSEGLWELLTLEKPTSYNEDDLKLYEDLLMKTSVYRQKNDPASGRFKSSAGTKYNAIIKPFLIKNKLLKTGKGLQKMYINRPFDYIYVYIYHASKYFVF